MNPLDTPLNLEQRTDAELLALLGMYPTEAERRVITRLLNARHSIPEAAIPASKKRVTRTEDEQVSDYRPLTRSAREEREREIRAEMARNWDGDTYIGGGR